MVLGNLVPCHLCGVTVRTCVLPALCSRCESAKWARRQEEIARHKDFLDRQRLHRKALDALIVRE